MIQQIERQDDPRLERYRHVGDARWLRHQHLFVAEGRLVVERLISGGGYEIDSILVTPPAFRALESTLQHAPLVYVADQGIVNEITGFNFHRGCVALARRPIDQPPLETFARARLVIVLEGIDNPDNLGGIFRSAAAFGVDGAILDPRSSDPWYRKAVRTSMGAVLRVPFTRIDADTWYHTFDALRRMGFVIVALTPAGELSIDAFVAREATARVAFVIGSEGAGLTPEVLALSDVRVRIPIDTRSDSLNVVVAVSIALQRFAQY